MSHGDSKLLSRFGLEKNVTFGLWLLSTWSTMVESSLEVVAPFSPRLCTGWSAERVGESILGLMMLWRHWSRRVRSLPWYKLHWRPNFEGGEMCDSEVTGVVSLFDRWGDISEDEVKVFICVSPRDLPVFVLLLRWRDTQALQQGHDCGLSFTLSSNSEGGCKFREVCIYLSGLEHGFLVLVLECFLHWNVSIREALPCLKPAVLSLSSRLHTRGQLKWC